MDLIKNNMTYICEQSVNGKLTYDVTMKTTLTTEITFLIMKQTPSFMEFQRQLKTGNYHWAKHYFQVV